MADNLLDDLGIPSSDYRVHVCLGPNCSLRGSRSLLAALEAKIWEKGLNRRVETLGTSCRDRCEFGPSINVYPGPVQYSEVNELALDAIIEEHLVHGRPVDRLIFRGKSVR